MSDPYLDPSSGILRNKFGITDQEILNRKEADVVMLRSVLLQGNPVKGNFDSDHLRQIHFHLFRDVYDWAGQFRVVPLAKAEYVHGGTVTRFTPPQSIPEELCNALDLLAQDGFLKGLRRNEFARKIAHLFSEMNRIHPFREGNGRAQREFVRQLSQSVGYKLHFGVVSRERMVQASMLSANGDVAMMERLMDEITDTERIQSLAKVIDHLERHELHWNDIYISTTTPGEQYEGTFAGADGNNFFFRDALNRIFVGRLSKLDQQRGGRRSDPLHCSLMSTSVLPRFRKMRERMGHPA